MRFNIEKYSSVLSSLVTDTIVITSMQCESKKSPLRPAVF